MTSEELIAACKTPRPMAEVFVDGERKIYDPLLPIAAAQLAARDAEIERLNKENQMLAEGAGNTQRALIAGHREDAARIEALQEENKRLREAADLDAAVSSAANKWRNEKDRETSSADTAWFKNNWQALPGLEDYVNREVGLRVRAALTAGEKQDG